MVDTSKRKLVHFDSDSFLGSQSIFQKVDSNLIVDLLDTEKNTSGYYFRKGQYRADAYKVTCNIPHNLPSTDTIVGAWTRSSSSYVYYSTAFDSVAFFRFLNPSEHVYIQNIDNNSATLYGYIYLLKDSANGNDLGWLPMDIHQIFTANFAYTLLIGDSINSYWDSILSLKPLITSQYEVTLYPSPTSGFQKIEIETYEAIDLDVTMYDILGRPIQIVSAGKLNAGTHSFTVDTKNFVSGVYFYRVMAKDLETIVIKTIKL